MVTIAFVCVGNAGRSQLAAGLAELERDRRAIDVDIVTGGVDPANQVYEEVRTVLLETDVDIGDRVPRQIERDDLVGADYIITMGCSVGELLPAGFDGEVRSWSIDADGESLPAYRQQREELAKHVGDLFDEIAESILD